MGAVLGAEDTAGKGEGTGDRVAGGLCGGHFHGAAGDRGAAAAHRNGGAVLRGYGAALQRQGAACHLNGAAGGRQYAAAGGVPDGQSALNAQRGGDDGGMAVQIQHRAGGRDRRGGKRAVGRAGQGHRGVADPGDKGGGAEIGDGTVAALHHGVERIGAGVGISAGGDKCAVAADGAAVGIGAEGAAVGEGAAVDYLTGAADDEDGAAAAHRAGNIQQAGLRGRAHTDVAGIGETALHMETVETGDGDGAAVVGAAAHCGGAGDDSGSPVGECAAGGDRQSLSGAHGQRTGLDIQRLAAGYGIALRAQVVGSRVRHSHVGHTGRLQRGF